MVTDKRRNIVVDNLKGIGILFVILGHVPHLSEPLYHYIFSFHMPLFFFCTGWLSFSADSRSFSAIVKKRIHSLLFPYLSFCILSTVVLLCGNFLHGGAPLQWHAVLRAIVLGGSSLTYLQNYPLWFLPNMFIVSLIFYWVVRLTKGRTVPLVILMVVLLPSTPRFQEFVHSVPLFQHGLPWLLEAVPAALVFCIAGRLYPRIAERTQLSMVPLLLLCIVNLYFGASAHSHIDNTGTWMFGPLAACAFIVYINFARSIKAGGIAWIGANSLYIFGIHQLFLDYYDPWAARSPFFACLGDGMMRFLFTWLVILTLSVLATMVWKWFCQMVREKASRYKRLAGGI